MLPTRFDDALARLLTAYERYRTTARTPENIAQLGRARLLLDQARQEAHEERPRIWQPPPRVPNAAVPATADEALRTWSGDYRYGMP